MALSNPEYNSILQAYERLQDEQRDLLMARTREVYRLLPEYQALDEETVSLSASMARHALLDDAMAILMLREKLSSLNLRKNRLLASAGLPGDYLSPRYICAECQDSGFVRGDDGTKRKCRCFREKELAIRYEQTRIREQLATETFENLTFSHVQGEALGQLQKAAASSREFVANFKKEKKDFQNLLFYGTVGTGKSFLSGCIANELLKCGYSVIYFSAIELFETCAKYTFDAKNREAMEEFNADLYDCDLLIIDDLGTEQTNSFVSTALFSCINQRILRKKSTIISTNLMLDEMQKRYSDRIFSRLISHYTIRKMTGPDVRILKRNLKM